MMEFILKYLLGQGLTGAIKKISQMMEGDELKRRLADTVSEWARETSEKVYINPHALYPLQDELSDIAELPRVNELFASITHVKIPSSSQWDAALLELWNYRKQHLGDEAAPFFKLDESEARPLLRSLAEKLNQVCNSDQHLFRNALVASAVGHDDLSAVSSVIDERLKELTSRGRYQKALDLISLLRRHGEVQKGSMIHEVLVLNETRLLIKMKKRDQYKNQIDLLEGLSPSFLKSYYLLILTKQFTPETLFDEFAKKYEIDSHLEELQIFFAYQWDEGAKPIIEDLATYDESTRAILAETVLRYYLNNDMPSRGEEFIEANRDYLKSEEAVYLLLLNHTNLILFSKHLKCLTNGDKERLADTLSAIEKQSFLFDESAEDSRQEYQLICSLTETFINDGDIIPGELGFEDDPNLLLKFVRIQKSIGNSTYLNHVIDNRGSYEQNVELDHDLIEYLYAIGDHQRIVDFNVDSAKLPKATELKVVYSNIITEFASDPGSFNQDSLTRLDIHTDLPLCTLLKSLLSLNIGQPDIGKQLFDEASQSMSIMNNDELLHYAEIALNLEDIQEAENAFQELIKRDRGYAAVYIHYMMKQGEQSLKSEYHIQLADLFSYVKIDGRTSIETLRAKAAYLQNSGDKDRAIDFQRKIAETYDDDFDWMNLLLMLVDYKRFEGILELEEHVDSMKDPLTRYLSHMIVSLFRPGYYKNTRLELFCRNFLRFHKQSSGQDEAHIPNHILAIFYYTIGQNNYFIKYENDFVGKDTFIVLKDVDDGSRLTVCLHDDREFISEENEEYLGSIHLWAQDPVSSQFLYKRKNEKIPYRGRTFIIAEIESIWNLAGFNIHNSIMKDPEAYHMRIIDIKRDPIVDIYPELYDGQRKREQEYFLYISRKYPMYLLTGKDYLRYTGAFVDLLSKHEKLLLGGIGKPVQNEAKLVLSFSSFLLLLMFNKFHMINLDRCIISKTFLIELENIIRDKEINPDQTRLAVGLDSDSIPVKYETELEDNLASLKSWRDILQSIKDSKVEIVDLSSESDTLTPYVFIMGKLEIDAFRIAKEKDCALIMDDHIVQIFCESNGHSRISNILPVYFSDSSEDLPEKVRFLNELSERGYRFILYPGLLKSVVSTMLESAAILVGPGTLLDSLASLVERESIIEYPNNLNKMEIAQGLKFLINNHMNPSSEEIVRTIIGKLDIKFRSGLRQYLVNELILNSVALRFIVRCFDD